jgi:hypothetical protein
MQAFSVVVLGPPPRLSRERRLAVVGAGAVTVTFLAEHELPSEPPNLLLAPIQQARDELRLLRALQHLGLPAEAGDRPRETTLVGAWFPAPWLSPEPLAPSVDLVLLGGEELLGRLTAILRSVHPRDHPEILRLLASLPGFYVPSLYRPVYESSGRLAAVEPLDPSAPLPIRALRPPVVAEPVPADLAWSLHLTAELLRARAAAGEKSLSLWVGSPEDADPETLGEQVENLLEMGIHHLHLGFSVSGHCFVPRPWTIWQWAPMASPATLKAELRVLSDTFRELPFTFTHDVPKWAAVEGLLARGDRRVADLLRLAQHVGWERAEVESAWNPAFYRARPRPLTEWLPWDHFDWGIDREALEREAISRLGPPSGPSTAGECSWI